MYIQLQESSAHNISQITIFFIQSYMRQKTHLADAMSYDPPVVFSIGSCSPAAGACLCSAASEQARPSVPPPVTDFYPSLCQSHTHSIPLKAYHFLGQLVSKQLVLQAFLLHLLALLVIVDGQLLQSLQHLLHLGLGAVALHLQPAELSLDLVSITFG